MNNAKQKIDKTRDTMRKVLEFNDDKFMVYMRAIVIYPLLLGLAMGVCLGVLVAGLVLTK